MERTALVGEVYAKWNMGNNIEETERNRVKR
jgi:hypothetical protein